ncbi:MAG: hypothetical protein ACI9V1_001457 [Spirosomataceae bacterium]|jgi:hypothetical protein
MKTETLLGIMKVLSWIVFIGLCINAGTPLITYGISQFVNPEAARNLFNGLDLFAISQSHRYWYALLVLNFSAITALKAYMMYCVIKVLSNINLENPFSQPVFNLVSKLSGLALVIGIAIIVTKNQTKWMAKTMDMGNYHGFFGGGDEFVFFAGILFIISLVFKRGMELQNESELTI